MTRAVPADDDILVRREQRDGREVFVLHTATGFELQVFVSCEEAIAQAVLTTKQRNSRAWVMKDDGAGFVRVGTSFGLHGGGEDEPHILDCERRLHRLIERLHANYAEMPGLRLTALQAQRLCGVQPTVCRLALELLVDEKFLRLNSDGTYGRATAGRHPRPATAHLSHTGSRTQKAS